MASYDVVIIGSGPAGLTAAVYTTRANLKTLVLAGSPKGGDPTRIPGGQLMATTAVENYPGFPDGVQGPELMDLFRRQAERFGSEIVDTNAVAVDFRQSPFRIKSEENEYEGRAVIIATGAQAKWLGLESERKLQNKGVSACAVCLPTGSRVMGNAAPVAIEDVAVGQRVLAHDGTFRRVTALGSRPYRGDLIRVTPRYFQEEPTLLTPEHPVLATTLEKGTGSRYWNWTWHDLGWVPAGELTPQHTLLYPIVSETRDVPSLRVSELLGLPRDRSGRVHFERETATSRRLTDDLVLNRDFMRLAGYFLADGTITPRGITFYFGPKDDSYVRDVVKIIERLFGYRPRVRRTGSVRRVECYTGVFRELFLKLFGKYSFGKSVPHWFLYLPIEKQAELVKGYWRGDGGTRTLGFTLTTNSPQLVAQFKMILLRLGIVPRISRRTAEELNRTRNVLNGREIRFRHDRYEFEIGGAWLEAASRVVGVSHPRIRQRTRTNAFAWIRDGYAFLPISDLARTPYTGNVHNLAVAGCNSYVTAGATVHNCDGYFFRGMDVVVVGGGDSAMEDAMFLSKLCKSVRVIHRRDSFRASAIMRDRLLKTPNVEVIWNTEVLEILGGDKVSGVRLVTHPQGAPKDVHDRNPKDPGLKVWEIPTQGVFVAIGHTPDTDVFKGHVELDKKGYIAVNGHVRTNVAGVFAAGDAHDSHYRQAVTAAGFGCMAALEAERWLSTHG